MEGQPLVWGIWKHTHTKLIKGEGFPGKRKGQALRSGEGMGHQTQTKKAAAPPCPAPPLPALSLVQSRARRRCRAA